MVPPPGVASPFSSQPAAGIPPPVVLGGIPTPSHLMAPTSGIATPPMMMMGNNTQMFDSGSMY